MRERELGQVFFGSRTYEAAGAIRTPWMVVLVLRGYKLFGGLGKKSLTHSNFQGPKREEDGEKEVKMTTKRRGYGFLFFSFLLFFLFYWDEEKHLPSTCSSLRWPGPRNREFLLFTDTIKTPPPPSVHMWTIYKYILFRQASSNLKGGTEINPTRATRTHSPLSSLLFLSLQALKKV